MKRLLSSSVSVFLIAAFSIGTFGFAFAEVEDPTIPHRKIVVFKDGVSDMEKARIVANARASKVKWLRNDNLLVVSADLAAEVRLAKNAKVARIEDDVVVEALDLAEVSGSKKPGTSIPAQIMPWGIDRSDADQVWALGEAGNGARIGVIDTGISSTHPDLVGNIKGGVSEVSYTSYWNDDNGHGTHVAGIVAATNNSIGVVGGAPSADVYAIKVLNRNGSGYLSDVVNGIDWAIANDMQVINLSLGADTDVQSLHDAIIRAYKAGIVVVAAAGNTGASVSYPAAYPETIAVAATDVLDTAPYWSSQGPEVSLAAPGVSIYSTYKGTKYAYMSGTSMAAPHVTAATALVLHRETDTAFDESGACVSTHDTNCNSMWDPNEVKIKLQDTSVDLGAVGRDDVYGYGLVDAFAAFTQ